MFNDGPDMVYYRVVVGSPAAKILTAHFEGLKIQREIATAIGKEWLKMDFSLIGHDGVISGFSFPPSSPMPWKAFLKKLPNPKIWVAMSNGRASWVTPKLKADKNGKPSKDLVAAWGAIPASEGMSGLTRQLFGAAVFCYNLNRASVTLWSRNGTTLVGMPWLAAAGLMVPMDEEGKGRPFKPVSGLQRLPQDNSLSIMYSEELKQMQADKIKAELAAAPATATAAKP